MHRSTKIVATLGPACSDAQVLERMLVAGVDVVRLNFSHGSQAEQIARAKAVREIVKKIGREIAIMVDLQGPKIRVSRFVNDRIQLIPGADFVLDANYTQLGTQDIVGLDYKTLAQEVSSGDRLLLNDGLIVLRVKEIVGSAVHTQVEVGGELSNNKGINRQGGGLSAPALTEKDKQDIQTAMQLGADYIAVSFAKSAEDMITARQLAQDAAKLAKHAEPMMIAKIERAEAIVVIDEILQASDGIMVARGDLALEVGNASVPALQKRLIKQAREANKFVITATQMMESMIVNPVPTRAEVSDVANAVLDGTDAVMTSAETASGRYPVETISTMATICLEAEKSNLCKLDADFWNQTFTRIDQSIACGALFTAYHLRVKAIAALTESGSTALWMSRHYIDIPIYAITPNISAQRKMALFRNVQTLQLAHNQDSKALLHSVEKILLENQFVQKGDLIVVTWGEPVGKSGSTNALKIVQVN